ncbi:MAG: hypothetical protein AMXMBFR7_28350 [Planctomycetota bacterium]
MPAEALSAWRPARIVQNEPMARGSIWLTLEAADGRAADFRPGHVLGLGLRQPDGSYLRHAYTVSVGDAPQRRFHHLYRVIPSGRLTPRLEKLRPGETIYFQGPGHRPIEDEVDPAAERIMGIATGTGIGPLFGYAQRVLELGEMRPITLFAGFREESDMCLRDELDGLAHRYPNFGYRYTLTRPSPEWRGLTGRVTDSLPPMLGRLDRLHVHLVGNGEMVHLFRSALFAAGMPRERVSIETYFNHSAEPPKPDVIGLAERLKPPAKAS